MKIKTIRISIDVWNEIAKRGNFGETENDVLKRVFGIDKKTKSPPKTFHRKGRLPPNGTKCRFNHKSKYIYGDIKDGFLIVVDYGTYTSFSKAASEISGTSLNGWLYWEIQLHETPNVWMSANKWRKSNQITSVHNENNDTIKDKISKLSWSEATQNAIKRYCSRHNSNIFTLKELIKEEIDNIVRDTQTKGKTPVKTLQYFLQKLRDQGIVDFIDNHGTYKFKQDAK